jgi:glycine amidinotransferase/scyllo-inosamine-4-phosphate amidinotransferase 1
VGACSHDEYSPLLEVVVGTAIGARLPPLARSTWLNLYPDLDAGELAAVRTGALPPRLLEEAQQDLDGLADFLRSLGVTVHRPAPIDHAAEIATPHWRTTGFSPAAPRSRAGRADLDAGPAIRARRAPRPVRAADGGRVDMDRRPGAAAVR